MSEVDLKSASTFSPKELEQITEAIELRSRRVEACAAVQVGLVLANFVNTQQGFCGTVGELVAWTECREEDGGTGGARVCGETGPHHVAPTR